MDEYPGKRVELHLSVVFTPRQNARSSQQSKKRIKSGGRFGRRSVPDCSRRQSAVAQRKIGSLAQARSHVAAHQALAIFRAVGVVECRVELRRRDVRREVLPGPTAVLFLGRTTN